jgi:methionine synthase II (cobalamin-independent)
MVMDAVENCLRAINNYNPNAVTRTGTPNAFAYFTQICYFAFLRRIEKEKKQQDIKFRYIEHAGITDFMSESLDGSEFTYGVETGFIDVLKNRIDKVKTVDKAVKEFKKKVKTELEFFMCEV